MIPHKLSQAQTLRLWQSDAPFARGSAPHDVPTITAFLPQQANGAAFIVCPGGGYQMLAEHEGEPVARWLNTLGITAFVLRYRHAAHGYKHPTPLEDVSRAVRTVRAAASQWSLDPGRIGVLGFSAGGHLTATLSTQFDAGRADAADPIDRLSSRPDLAVLLYAVITMRHPLGHAGSRSNLLGEHVDLQTIDAQSAELRVKPQTPPTFLFHTMDDPVVQVEHAFLYASALRAAEVPFEMHVYERGPHGVGLAADRPALSTWPILCGAWLKLHGF